jgi:hypothetical protein
MSFDALSDKATSLSPPYKAQIELENEFWEESPFEWIRHLASRTRGKIGQDLARSVFSQYGYRPSKRKDSFDVEGKTIISRYSTPWLFTTWQFQQVRDSSFDYLFCLGITPDSASAWLIPKEELYVGGELQERAGWGRQHGGRAGTEDSWLVAPTENVPQWLGEFGGNIDGIERILRKYLG